MRNTSEFGSQDWILIIEALARFAGPECSTDMERHAWELVCEIAAEQGLPPAELIQQSVY